MVSRLPTPPPLNMSDTHWAKSHCMKSNQRSCTDSFKQTFVLYQNWSPPAFPTICNYDTVTIKRSWKTYRYEKQDNRNWPVWKSVQITGWMSWLHDYTNYPPQKPAHLVLHHSEEKVRQTPQPDAQTVTEYIWSILMGWWKFFWSATAALWLAMCCRCSSVWMLIGLLCYVFMMLRVWAHFLHFHAPCVSLSSLKTFRAIITV